MGVAERSREHVEAKMEVLAESYGSFTINQTTITLPGEQYTSMRKRGSPEPVSAYIAVRNDDEDVLHVDGDDPELPGVELPLGASLEPAVRETVSEQTGVDCVVDGIDHVTIAGLRNGDDTEAETLYNLVVVFSGHPESGVPTEAATWQQLDDGIELAYA